MNDSPHQALDILLGSIESDQFNQILLANLKTMHLVNDQDQWVFAELRPYFPASQAPTNPSLPRVSAEDLKAFTEQTVRAALRSHYFMDLVNAMSTDKASLTAFSRMVQQGGSTLLPRYVALCFLLNCLTHAMHQDPSLIKLLYDFWEKKITPSDVRKSALKKNYGFFGIVKLYSVQWAVRSMINRHSVGTVPTFLGKIFINILEAVIADWMTGHKDNAYAGWVLAKHTLPVKKHDKYTHGSACHWSKDYKSINHGYPLPKEWNDLYAAWNLSFCFGRNAFDSCKLLIPMVNDYVDDPHSYVYKRGLALFCYLNYLLFEKNMPTAQKMPEVVRLVGKTNRLNALRYEQTLKEKEKLRQRPV